MTSTTPSQTRTPSRAARPPDDGPLAAQLEQLEQLEQLGPWFHNLHLPDGTQTCPDHWLGDFPSYKWDELRRHLPADLTGWSCLDIGCNAGFYAFELAKLGASVLGIDIDRHYLRQAQWAAERMGLQHAVQFQQMQVYDLARRPNSEQFDLVLFMGVFYHLRYPMLGLDIVCQPVRRMMVFQTLTTADDHVRLDTDGLDFDDDRAPLDAPGWPKMSFLEHRFAGDCTNWWAANHAGVEAMLRSAGMRVTGRPGHEIYLCEPDPQHPSCVATWNVGEFDSAAGRGAGAAAPQRTQ